MKQIKLSELENLPQEELVQIVQSVNDLKKAQQVKRLEYYLSNAHIGQVNFHKDTHRIRIVIAGNRGGKTTGGTAELVWRCIGTHPFQKVKIPIKSAVVLQDFENHGKNIFEPKLNEWVPSGAIKKIEKHQGGAFKRIFWSTVSTTDIYSHDQDIKVFEGSDYDYVWFDEPPPLWIWNAMWRSCTDRGGMMSLTGTPLSSPWLYEEYQKWKGTSDHLKNFIQFDSYTNAKNLGDGDETLGKKRIDELASQYSEEEQEARIKGGFIQLSGLIFKNWDRQKHLIKPFPWPPDWEIIESIDPHSQKDWAISWVGIAPNGSKVLLHSIYSGGVLDEIANDILLNRENLGIKDNLRPKITRCLIDNAASVPLWQRSNTDMTARRLSLREELENLIGPRGAGGPRIEVCPKNVSQKIDIMRRWLHEKERKGRMRPDFMVFDKPENEGFVFEIENYVWDRYRNRNVEGLKAKPVKKNDDLLDTIMQICLILKDGDEVETSPMSTIRGFGTYGL